MRLRRLLRDSVLTFAACSLASAFGGAAFAQTLEEQYRFFLHQRCAQLGFERDGDGNLLPGQAGANLAAFCSGIAAPGDGTSGPGPSTTTSAAGGGATATGRSALDAGAEQLRERSEQAREGESADASSTTQFDLFESGRTAVFLSLDRRYERQQVTHFEDGRRSHALAAALGADYRIGTTAILGAALTHTDLSGDFNGGGEFETRGGGVWLYGSWFLRERAFVDFGVGMDSLDQRTQRLVGLTTIREFPDRTTITIDPPLRLTDGSTDTRERSAAVSGGFDAVVRNLVLGPRIAFDTRRTRVERFVEAGATPMTLAFDAQTVRSQRASVGVQASRALALQSGASVILQLNLDWLRELENDQRVITARFAEDLRDTAPRLAFLNQPPDRNWHNVRASAVAVFSRSLSAFASVESTFGHAYLDAYGVSLGVRREFQ